MSRDIELSASSSTIATDDTVLSLEEWRAVEIALRDAEKVAGGRDLTGDGLIVRFWRWLTGFEPPRHLADPRLDAIRRFVWALRRHGAKAMEMRPELRKLGLSAAQVATLARVAA